MVSVHKSGDRIAGREHPLSILIQMRRPIIMPNPPIKPSPAWNRLVFYVVLSSSGTALLALAVARADQAAIAALVLFSLGAMACYWIVQGGLHGRMIHIDRVDPLTVHYQVDLNTAEKPELVTLPEIGDTLTHSTFSITTSNTAASIRSTTCGECAARPKTMEHCGHICIAPPADTVATQKSSPSE